MEEERQSAFNILVIWRGKKLNVEMGSGGTLKEFGHRLQKLTNVKADTMRLLVPRSTNEGSKMLTPFSDEHSSLNLQEASILEGKPIRMMGVFEDEIKEVKQNATANLRIAGFDEEEKRLRQRMLDMPQTSLKLSQGKYIFCDFRTLQIPGIKLNPPASEALRRMHMLAADPGIIAIMDKHRWRVGIMTEMAPVGYVGISPKCILGYNKNQGEEISLRLRTDDLKGFRKYESIKKTLLHELAHMEFSEHDANFFALNKQLNEEAASLDWTRSRSHTVSGVRPSEYYEEESYVGSIGNTSQRLGGEMPDQLASARASSVAAAYSRLANASTNSSGGFGEHVESHSDDSEFIMHEPDPDDSEFIIHEPDPDDSEFIMHEPDPDDSEFIMHEPDPDDSAVKESMQVDNPKEAGCNPNFEPDPDDSQGGKVMKSESFVGTNTNRITSEPDQDDCEVVQYTPNLGTKRKLVGSNTFEEPDPDDSELNGIASKCGVTVQLGMEDGEGNGTSANGIQQNSFEEPDPDDSGASLEHRSRIEPDPDDSQGNGIMQFEPDPDDQELKRIQDPVSVACARLQRAIEMLRSEVNSKEVTSVLQTLFKIIRNVIEHPDEMKFRRLRKANPLFQRNVANYKAAMEVLFLVGFNEDVASDEVGRSETFVVLKRNDPGLLWLAKSSLEMCIAC